MSLVRRGISSFVGFDGRGTLPGTAETPTAVLVPTEAVVAAVVVVLLDPGRVVVAVEIVFDLCEAVRVFLGAAENEEEEEEDMEEEEEETTVS